MATESIRDMLDRLRQQSLSIKVEASGCAFSCANQDPSTNKEHPYVCGPLQKLLPKACGARIASGSGSLYVSDCGALYDLTLDSEKPIPRGVSLGDVPSPYK